MSKTSPKKLTSAESTGEKSTGDLNHNLHYDNGVISEGKNPPLLDKLAADSYNSILDALIHSELMKRKELQLHLKRFDKK